MNVISLFAGCGGGDLGTRGGFTFLNKHYPKTGLNVVWANELDAYAAETYRANIGDHVVVGDIREIESEEIPEHDILIGGFPCQSFSIVGQRGGLDDPRGMLYLEMLRVLEEKKPKAFIGENVKGILSIDGGKTIDKIKADFEKAGYKIEVQLLNAADFGVPQKRERVFIVGIRDDLQIGEFAFPKPTTPKRDVPLNSVLHEPNQIPEKYFFSQRAVDGLHRANRAFNKGRAQNVDGPCNTISTHLAKVSLNGTDPVLLEQGKYRRFTPREAAGIQSFPRSFKLVGSDTRQYIQIGNAIPPVLMWHVANAVKLALDSKQ